MTMTHASAPAGQSTLVHLRLLHTTDLHMQLLAFDYVADRCAPGTGLAASAALIARLRRRACNSLLLDSGDMLQGTPLGDYVALERNTAPERVHPAIAAMNALGYDAGTLGNHDFDFGLAVLRDAVAQAVFPIVSANLAEALAACPTDDTTLVAPYALLDRTLRDKAGRAHAIRIGVIGFAPPPLFQWGREPGPERLAARDIIEAARAWVPRLRAAGADIVVALAHSGIGAAAHCPGMENAAIPLGRVPGIDAILAGHTHQVFPAPCFAGWPGVDLARGTLGGTPAMMSGSHGTHLGVMDLQLAHDGVRWRVATAHPRVATLPARRARAAPEVLRAVHDDHAATRRRLDAPVGSTRTPLHSHFALLGTASAPRLLMAAQRAHVAHQLAGTAFEGLALLSAVAPFKAGGYGGPDNYTDIAPGPLRRRDLHDLCPYANTVCAVSIDGAELRDWLERAAAGFRRIRAGARDAPLCDPGIAAHNFDLVDGVDYVIDPTRAARYHGDGTPTGEAGGRIVTLSHNGRPVRPRDRFVVVTNSFRAAGGGGFPQLPAARIVYRGATLTRDALLAHVCAASPVAGDTRPIWRFAHHPRTSVVFDTAPGAVRHLSQVSHLCPEPLGHDARGYLRLRLHL